MDKTEKSKMGANIPLNLTEEVTPPLTSPSERRATIVNLAKERGELLTASLSSELGVSPETIRRDLRQLEQTGQIIRTYGTLRASESGLYETTFEQRTTRSDGEKHRIAKAAATELGSAEIIYIDEGYLPSLIGALFPAQRQLTVVTPSLVTAIKLSELPHLNVISVGGRLRKSTYGTVDYWALQMINSMKFDLAYLGANGIDNNGLLFTPDPAVAATKRSAIDNSRRKIFIATHAKFGKTSFVQFSSLQEMDCLITGTEIRPATKNRLIQKGIEIITV